MNTEALIVSAFLKNEGLEDVSEVVVPQGLKDLKAERRRVHGASARTCSASNATDRKTKRINEISEPGVREI